MYRIVYLGNAAEEVATLPPAGLGAYLELIGAMQLVPWNFADRAGGNMPSIPFGPHGEGLAAVMIWDDDLTLNVTKVQWAA